MKLLAEVFNVRSSRRVQRAGWLCNLSGDSKISYLLYYEIADKLPTNIAAEDTSAFMIRTDKHCG
jgi:hypothetical protein